MVTEKILSTKYSLEYLYMTNGVVKNTVQVFPKIKTDITNEKFYNFGQDTAVLLDTNQVSATKTLKILLEG